MNQTLFPNNKQEINDNLIEIEKIELKQRIKEEREGTANNA